MVLKWLKVYIRANEHFTCQAMYNHLCVAIPLPPLSSKNQLIHAALARDICSYLIDKWREKKRHEKACTGEINPHRLPDLDFFRSLSDC